MELAVVWLLTSAGVFMVTVIFGEIYRWLRNLMPKSVQCWFCCHKTEVPYNLSNSWHCPQCEQYNGFTKDGDYNKTIQQQFNEMLNYSVSISGRCKNGWRSSRSLCTDCNRNQQLKVKQLANFVPINENNYDYEIEHFRSQIEKAYKLCPNCDKLVYNVLMKERVEYSVPRVLNLPLSSEGRRGTSVLYVFILVSFALALMGFIQTNAAKKLYNRLWPFILPYVNKLPSSLRGRIDMKWATILKSGVVKYIGCVELFGAVLSLFVYYHSRKSPIVLLFNSLAWLSLMGFSLHWSHFVVTEWVHVCQIILGVVSSLLSFSVVADIYSEARAQHQRHQAFLQCKMPKNANVPSKYHSPPTTSTPRGTPPQSQSFSYVESSSLSTKNSSLGLHTSIKDVGLEPGIRGLNLGKTSFRTRDDDVHSLWSGVHSHYSIGAPSVASPFSTAWSTYSATPNITVYPATGNTSSFVTNSARLGTSLPGSVAFNNFSRSASPSSIMGMQFGAGMNSTFSESNLKRRNL